MTLDRRHLARLALSLRLVSALLPLACAAGTRGSGNAPTQPAPDAPLAWLVSDEVLVLPLQELDLHTVASRSDSAVLRGEFESALEAAVAPSVPSGRWVWPPALVALRRRNPTVMPDPTRLPVRGLRPGMAAESQLSQDLGSDIRTILAIAGARRYVLLPFRVVITGDDPAAHGYEVHLFAIDSRRAIVSRGYSHAAARAGTARQALVAAAQAAAAAIIVPER